MISTVTKLPTARRRIDETDLCGWIGQAAPGEALEYYRGFLAMDTFSQAKRLTERERAELMRVARRAWWASAIARSKPKQASASLSSLLLAEVA